MAEVNRAPAAGAIRPLVVIASRPQGGVAIQSSRCSPLTPRHAVCFVQIRHLKDHYRGTKAFGIRDDGGRQRPVAMAGPEARETAVEMAPTDGLARIALYA